MRKAIILSALIILLVGGCSSAPRRSGPGEYYIVVNAPKNAVYEAALVHFSYTTDFITSASSKEEGVIDVTGQRDESTRYDMTIYLTPKKYGKTTMSIVITEYKREGGTYKIVPTESRLIEYAKGTLNRIKRIAEEK